MTEQLTEPQAGTAVVAAPAVPAGPTRVAWAPVPKVNLLPNEILEARRFRRLQAILATGLAATVAAAVIGTLWANAGVNDARNDLASAQTAVTALQAQQSKYADVPKVTAQVDAAISARSLALGNDILWYRFLNDLEGVTPDGVLLPNLTVALSTTVDTASGNPLAPAGIGTFSASGTAGNYQQVASLMDGLDKVNGLRSSALTSATRQAATDGSNQDVVNVTLGSVLSSDALSGRYDKKAD